MVPNLQLYLGDCLAVVEGLPDGSIDAVVTDPPYGCKNNCNYTRFTHGSAWHGHIRNSYPPIVNDDKPFDPTPWLGYPEVIIFGYQFFADKVPQGTVLVWLKKQDSMLGKWLSDCELAWQKGGSGVWLYKQRWQGFVRDGEPGPSLHPTQKPVGLMRWCIERVTKPGDTVLDPFMGSGSTGVACVQTGRNFIGIEISEHYFKIAQRRIADAQAQLRLSLEEANDE